MQLLRKIIILIQYTLGISAVIIGFMMWQGSMDFKYVSQFLALLSLLTGCIIFTSCTSDEIVTKKRFFAGTGIFGGLAGIGSALVFWQYLPPETWYYINLLLVTGVCASLFAETEKGRTIRSVIHAVTSLIILLNFTLTILHITGLANLKLPLFILSGANFLLLSIVVYRNFKNQSL